MSSFRFFMRCCLPAVLAASIAVGCSTQRSPGTPTVVARDARDAQLLLAVGPKPRLFMTSDLRADFQRLALWDLAAMRNPASGRALSECGIQTHALRAVRIAIGEPLRIRAELDGAINTAAVACFLGLPLIRWLVDNDFTVRDRPGGILIERDTQIEPEASLTAIGRELVSRCAPSTTMTSCMAASVGPATREVLFSSRQEGDINRLRIAGPGFAGAAKVLVEAIRIATFKDPAMAVLMKTSDQNGEFEVAVPLELLHRASKVVFDLVRPVWIEGDSMAPLITHRNLILSATVAVAGAPVPGDVITYATESGLLIGRYIAGAGQVVTETAEGIAVDGTLLRTEPIADETVREHVGGHAYHVRRTTPAGRGEWTVPEGHVFVLSDNRAASTDSRTSGPISSEAIHGRVIGIVVALEGRLPAWERIGVLGDTLTP